MGRRLLRRFAVAAGLTLAALLAVVAWQWLRDPFAALPRAAAAPTAVSVTDQRREGRLLRHVTLADPALGEVGLLISLPDPLPDRRLPVLIVLGGHGTGADNIRHIPDVGDNALVGYDWPVPAPLPEGFGLIRSMPDLYRRLLRVPAQVGLGMDWLATQPWADGQRFSLLGFSLGALAAPAAQRVAQTDGAAPGWTVLAYGGAPIGALVAGHPSTRPDWLRPLAGFVADTLLRPLEPAEHLPHLTGRFLVLGGRDDRFVPAAAAQRLRALTPEPRSVVEFDGDHMGVGEHQLTLLAQIIDTSAAWLIAEGAVTVP